MAHFWKIPSPIPTAIAFLSPHTLWIDSGGYQYHPWHHPDFLPTPHPLWLIPGRYHRPTSSIIPVFTHPLWLILGRYYSSTPSTLHVFLYWAGIHHLTISSIFPVSFIYTKIHSYKIPFLHTIHSSCLLRQWLIHGRYHPHTPSIFHVSHHPLWLIPSTYRFFFFTPSIFPVSLPTMGHS